MTGVLDRPAEAAPAPDPPRPDGPEGRAAGPRIAVGPKLAAELALVLVSLATVYGFARLYDDLSFFPPLAALALAGHALAALCRARRAPAWLAAVVAVVGGGLLSAWLFVPGETLAGLPTPHTLSAARDAFQAAMDRFGQVVAPAPVLPGFQLAAGLAVWGMVWFADWSAFRIWATAESVAPASVLFVFGAMLGAPQHRTTTTVAFVAATLLFVLLHRIARQDTGRTWVTASPVLGRRALVRLGVGGIGLAVVAGAVLGPHVPGARDEPLVKWRQTKENRSRVTVSPLVDIRKRLVDQSETPAFDVTTNRRSYWRLTSLDDFDGRIWSSSGEFGKAGDRLPETGAQPPKARRVVQEVEIANLSAIWVPAAYEARQVQAEDASLRWDERSQTLIVDNDRTTSDNLRYRVVSQAPIFTASELQQANGAIPRATTRRYTALPGSLPPEVRRLARQITQGQVSEYGRARALQDWFRDQFTYDLRVEPGHSDADIIDFLRSKRGYCEQFAGTYAAMARSLGLPARVAVGFTPGNPDPEQPGLYHVLGKHAHAWPEVYFSGLGWVPFEPTPGRGAPGAEAWTGVREQQDAPRAPVTTTTTTTTTPDAPASTTPGSTTERKNLNAVNGQQGGGGGGGSSALGTLGLGLAVLVALVVVAWLGLTLVVPWIRRRRRRAAAHTAVDRVQLAWDEANEPVDWLTGLRPEPWESHAEFASRAAPELSELAVPHGELASLATRASWSEDSADDDDVAHSEAAARRVAAGVRGKLTTRQRWARRLSLRRALVRPG